MVTFMIEVNFCAGNSELLAAMLCQLTAVNFDRWQLHTWCPTANLTKKNRALCLIGAVNMKDRSI